jgi:hypothetical protein
MGLDHREKGMTSQRRAAVTASSWALTALALLASSCPGVAGGNPSGFGFGSDCVAVRTGAWEFELSNGGAVFLSFVDGNLTQSGCFLSYDEDRVFEGDLTASMWNVSSDAGGFSFSGVFSGNPATTFAGTFRDSRGLTAAMAGRYVGR